MKAPKEHKPQQSRVIQCGKGGKKGTKFSKFLSKYGEHNVFVYGTETARDALRMIDTTIPKGFKNKKEHNPVGASTEGFFTVDIYNNFSWRDFEYNGKSNFSIFNPEYQPDNVNQIIIDLKKWTKSLTFTNDIHKKEVLNYQRELLDHPSYSPIVTYIESDDFIMQKTGYSEREIHKARFELQTRRACKFGLEYMTKKPYGMIAFLPSVDGVEMPDDDLFITTKQKTQSRAGGRVAGVARIPITTSELLKAFRLNSSYIRFFDTNGSQYEPSWEHDRRSWDDYSKKRREKYANLFNNLFSSDPNGYSTEELKKMVLDRLRTIYQDKEYSNSELLFMESLNF